MGLPIKNSHGLTEINSDIYFLTHRIIKIYGEIDQQSAEKFDAEFSYLEMEGNIGDPIYLWVNSPGGSISAGLAIISKIKTSLSPVFTYNLGIAASMASVIYSCGKERFMMPDSKVLLHEGSVSGFDGNCTTASEMLIRLKADEDICNTIICQNTGLPLEEIERFTKNRDWWLNANECLAKNIATDILSAGWMKKFREM